jgi:L-lactate dehydrogenase complex protein LldE
MRVSIFATCLVDQFFPRTGLAMAEVLERAGCTVEFREAQTCCGQPAFNAGYPGEARAVARHFAEVFAGAEHVIVPAGSCAAMLSRHLPELLEDAGPLAGRVHEFATFLADVLGVEDLGARYPAVATYHDSCHALRELGVKSAPRRLLAHVRGLELREMDLAEECCGFGGTFAVKFPEVSAAMGRTKAESIARTGADTVISIDSGCLMQLAGVLGRAGSPVRAVHLAEVLASR